MSARDPNNVGRDVQTDPRSYGRNFSNCVEKPEKFSTSTGGFVSQRDSFHIYPFVLGSNIVELHFGDHGAKEMLGVLGSKGKERKKKKKELYLRTFAPIATAHIFAHVTHTSYIADQEGKHDAKGANIFHKNGT